MLQGICSFNFFLWQDFSTYAIMGLQFRKAFESTAVDKLRSKKPKGNTTTEVNRKIKISANL